MKIIDTPQHCLNLGKIYNLAQTAKNNQKPLWQPKALTSLNMLGK